MHIKSDFCTDFLTIMSVLSAHNVKERVIAAADVDSLASVKLIGQIWYRMVWARYRTLVAEFVGASKSAQYQLCAGANVEWLSLVDKALVRNLVRDCSFPWYKTKLILACGPDDHYIVKRLIKLVECYNDKLHTKHLRAHVLALISQNKYGYMSNSFSIAITHGCFNGLEHNLLPIVKLRISIMKSYSGLRPCDALSFITDFMVSLSYKVNEGITAMYQDLQELLPATSCEVMTSDGEIITTYSLLDAMLLISAVDKNRYNRVISTLKLRFNFPNMLHLNYVLFPVREITDTKSPLINALIHDFSERCRAKVNFCIAR